MARRSSKSQHQGKRRTSRSMRANALLLQNTSAEIDEELQQIRGILEQRDEGLITNAELALGLSGILPHAFLAELGELLRREKTLGAVLDTMNPKEIREFMKSLKSRKIRYEDAQLDPDGAYNALVWLRTHREGAARAAEGPAFDIITRLNR